MENRDPDQIVSDRKIGWRRGDTDRRKQISLSGANGMRKQVGFPAGNYGQPCPQHTENTPTE